MIPVLNILFYSLIFLFLSGLILFWKKIKLSAYDWGSLAGGAVILTALSGLIYYEKVGGTILYRAYGWPHFFMNYQVKDILDDVIIDSWSFTPGGLGSYLIADIIFYFSVLLLVLAPLKILKKYINQ